jgi:AcrR family transcriptional regulator
MNVSNKNRRKKAPLRGAATGKRPYQSDLREKQREQTRNDILDSFCAMISEKGPEACTIPEIAKRAGVALRTVYHHFPAREDLLAALAQAIRQKHGGIGYPKTPEEIPAIVAALFAQFDLHPDLIQAQLLTSLGREVRDLARIERVKAVRAALRPISSHLPSEEAEGAAAIIKHLFSAETWWAIKRDFGLDGAAAGRITAKAIGLLIEDLADRNRMAFQSKSRTSTRSPEES